MNVRSGREFPFFEMCFQMMQQTGVAPTVRRTLPWVAIVAIFFLCQAQRTWAQLQTGSDVQTGAPGAADLPTMIQHFRADHQALQEKYSLEISPQRQTRMAQFYRLTQEDLRRVDFARLDQDSKIDFLLLDNHLKYLTDELNRSIELDAKIAVALPEVAMITRWFEQRIGGQRIDGQAYANDYSTLQKAARSLQNQLQSPSPELSLVLQDPTLALWSIQRLPEIVRALDTIHKYYDGYDPAYSWWARQPQQESRAAVLEYQSALRQIILGDDWDDPDAIVGQPIGREALSAELRHEMIAYSPEALVEIAQQEMAWCDAEMDKAAAELGFDDWRLAQEAVKEKFVSPGEQTYLIREMAEEATAYVVEHDLVTVPELAREVWRMEMMSPERQKVNPYFLGGDTIIVSYPTDEMSHADKLMSLRGNNPHFSRAVVHHELIPGHHLQMFMMQRHRGYRQEFQTPFWMEGWALYWEMLLWDRGFARSPEDKIGMLFWRKHRCARIIFSLSYHLKEMSARQCIDYLVDRVGHERNNATAEVRRSIMGGYSPLYQAAYMLGGLQIRELHQTLVESGKMSDREFHDTILQQNSIPIAMVRAKLLELELTPEFEADWQFYPRVPLRISRE